MLIEFRFCWANQTTPLCMERAFISNLKIFLSPAFNILDVQRSYPLSSSMPGAAALIISPSSAPKEDFENRNRNKILIDKLNEINALKYKIN